MNEYSVFWIKDEFALHYFHKSGILYRFIKAYQQNLQRQDLSQQFQYITKSFSKAELIKHFQETHDRLTINISDHEIELSDKGQFLTLHVYQESLKFYCETIHEAENLLFPILRSYNPYLFVFGNNIENYGWITPVIKNSLNKNRQILYSYH